MSQGELHALALALFLPRATAADSPFRFVVLDDPIQAMDPAKIDGFVQVLADIAQTHQVIVFSHDDRLASVIRETGVDARLIEVVRESGSKVTVRDNVNPACASTTSSRSSKTTAYPTRSRAASCPACSAWRWNLLPDRRITRSSPWRAGLEPNSRTRGQSAKKNRLAAGAGGARRPRPTSKGGSTPNPNVAGPCVCVTPCTAKPPG